MRNHHSSPELGVIATISSFYRWKVGHKRVLGTVLFATLMTGCATSRDIADQATKGNIGVEDAHNQVLLLNALRAYKRRPMYFTAISQFTGPLGTVSPSATFTLPFGPVTANNSFSPTLKADTPIFTLVVLDGQKFIAGITKPATAVTVKYYLDQGWPPQFLLSLMIREIIYEAETGVAKRVVNHPGNPRQFAEFQSELNAMVACGLTVKAFESTDQLEGPALEFKSEGNAAELINAAKEKLSVARARDVQGKPKGGWALARHKSDIGIHFTDLESPTCKTIASETQRERFVTSETREKTPQQTPEQSNPAEQETFNLSPNKIRGLVVGGDTPAKADAMPKGNALRLSLFVRSPEAIIYYLGELVRVKLEGDIEGNTYLPSTTVRYTPPGATPVIECQEPIFRVSLEPSPGRAISVVYDGQEYSVASPPAAACPPGTPRTSITGDRSSHALSLVSQLIGLQKDAGEIPQSTVIRAISP
ncbi:MAG: hypothetical protein HYX43_12780 [Burkholderiales bacterium]|nr:hypothetical protein [Burkholderiales bacterium]